MPSKMCTASVQKLPTFFFVLKTSTLTRHILRFYSEHAMHGTRKDDAAPARPQQKRFAELPNWKLPRIISLYVRMRRNEKTANDS